MSTLPAVPVLVSSRAVIWADGAVHDLDAQLDEASAGWTIESPRDMNENGWITAVARWNGQMHAVVLIPQAE